MAKLFAPFYLLLARFVFTSVRRMAPMVNACELATIGGGCPDVDQCQLTCGPCYRNVGRVTSYCRLAGGEVPSDECVCAFHDGAPCPPIGGPKCPNWPRSVVAPATNFTAN